MLFDVVAFGMFVVFRPAAVFAVVRAAIVPLAAAVGVAGAGVVIAAVVFAVMGFGPTAAAHFFGGGAGGWFGPDAPLSRGTAGADADSGPGGGLAAAAGVVIVLCELDISRGGW